MKSTKNPKVYLVGAGPGDIGLFTIKGIRCLRKADVVIYDYHLNPQILNYIDHDAEFIYAGKRGGHHAMTQDEINAVLVQKALEGKTVCRLKGGDPFVFGRGGEEAEALYENGIPFEIVPGVSSSIAAPAYAGIPLTHRKHSSSFSVIAGNEDITKNSSTIDWANLASGLDTLVFLMGVKNVDAIAAKLLEHGKSPDTPAAVVRWGTRPEQQAVTGTLSTLAALVKDTHIKPPAVMIIGDVVKLREKLKWYENKPLFGHRVLITNKYSDDYEPLADLGAELFEFPTIELAPPESYAELDAAMHAVSGYDWIVFTSKNAVSRFMQRYFSLGHDIRDMKGIKFCAVGSKTAEALNACGIKVDMVPDEFNAEGLVKLFAQQTSISGLKILLPRPDNGRDVFPSMIMEAGGHIDTPVIYRSIKPEKHGKRLQRFLKEGRISIATFTSGAAFNNFISIMGDDAASVLQGVPIAVIGPVTKRAVEKAGFKAAIMPDESTVKAMVDAIAVYAAGAAKA